MKRRSKYLPKIVLCAVGGAKFRDFAEAVLDEAGVEHEFRGPDARMREAFEASSSGAWGSLTDADYRKIEQHKCVVYALSDNYDRKQAAEVAHRFLRLGRILLSAGATGLKIESSGVAHGKQHWIELAEQADRGLAASERERLDEDERTSALMDFWGALIESYVQLPLVSNERDFHSCGMHLLGQPDLIISEALLERAFLDMDSAYSELIELFFLLGYYLLAECPRDGIEDGHTFRLREDSPRFRLKLEDCTGYDEDEFFFNPYGRWRFAEVVKESRARKSRG